MTSENLVRTLRTTAPEAAFRAWEDPARDLLFVELSVGGHERRLTFGDVTQHALDGLYDQQRIAVLTALLADAATWPSGTADVRSVRDVANIKSMRGETDICVFIAGEPVSTVVRIITPMEYGTSRKT